MELPDEDALAESMDAKNASLLFGAGFFPIQALTGTSMEWGSELVHPDEEDEYALPVPRTGGRALLLLPRFGTVPGHQIRTSRCR